MTTSRLHITARASFVFVAALCAGTALADDTTTVATSSVSTLAPVPSKHQFMKECMQKERAADSGRPSYELSAECRDIASTEKQNADAQRKARLNAAT